jgi:hypothetical protein
MNKEKKERLKSWLKSYVPKALGAFISIAELVQHKGLPKTHEEGVTLALGIALLFASNSYKKPKTDETEHTGNK